MTNPDKLDKTRETHESILSNKAKQREMLELPSTTYKTMQEDRDFYPLGERKENIYIYIYIYIL
jgi:hypothetical protein